KSGINGYFTCYSLGLTYLNLNNFDEALSYFEKAQKSENKFLPSRLAVETLKDKLLNTGVPKLTLAVCMIVKNEETFIKKALESVKDIADEIIVLDTGSTDSTKEILTSTLPPSKG